MPTETVHLSAELKLAFDRTLDRAHLPQPLRADYHKWIELYVTFCTTAGYHPTTPTALGPFLTSLGAQAYSIDQRHHARAAVKLLVRPDPQDGTLYLQLSDLTPNLRDPGQPPGSASNPPKLRSVSWEREYQNLIPSRGQKRVFSQKPEVTSLREPAFLNKHLSPLRRLPDSAQLTLPS